MDTKPHVVAYFFSGEKKKEEKKVCSVKSPKL